VSYQSKQFLTSLNEGYVPARSISNATIGFHRGNYELQLWARNLFDEEYVSASFATVTNTASAHNGTLGEPLTFGMRLRARF
jgi:outer membrane receptor protein involved in Fe transport